MGTTQPDFLVPADEGGAEQFGRLFVALGEELKLPLEQIARQAELQQLANGELREPMQRIRTSADMSLHLLDSYLMSLRLGMLPEAKLALEPVSVAAVLHETVETLRTTARQYSVDLRLHVDGKYAPVLAHQAGLKSALLALGYALVEALPAHDVPQLRLQFAAHRTKYGIVAGMYGQLPQLTPQVFRRGQALAGQARQPLPGVLPGGGAGVFVADMLLRSMQSQLRVGRFQKMPGFAVTLPPSEQLQLV